MRREPVKASCRISRSGPAPHTVFVMCGTINGRRYHVSGETRENTFDPVFSDIRSCDGSCRGYLAINDNACAWLQSLDARKAILEPLRGAT